MMGFASRRHVTFPVPFQFRAQLDPLQALRPTPRPSRQLAKTFFFLSKK